MEPRIGFLVQQLGRECDEASRRHEEALSFLLMTAAEEIQAHAKRIEQLTGTVQLLTKRIDELTAPKDSPTP